MPSESPERPLEGLRVLDLADEKGELAGRLMADFGADVIRVEPPGGARSRSLPPFDGDTSLYFAYRNFNKRGIVLDLEEAGGREQLADLASRADVLVESFAPGHLAGLGLDPTSLLEGNPALVALSITDFGQTGPYKDWIATDATMEAIGGMQFKAGVVERDPLLPPGSIAYDTAGVVGAFAALSALLQRERSGRGQAIDLSVLEAVAQITDWSFSNATHVRSKGQASPDMRMGNGPMYRVYECKGGHVRLVILSPRQWHAMREWLGNPEYLQDPMYDSFLGRMQIADALAVMINDLWKDMPHEEVAFEAQRRGIVCTPVLRPEEVLANEHYRSRNTFVDAEYAPGRSGPIAAGFMEIDRQRQGYRQRAPEIGEHQALLDEGLWSEPRPAPSGDAPPPSLPFEGLRVLDFGHGGVGVEAGRMFAEYGADVIKMESRSYPDFIRVVMSTEMSASFASSSRSKRGFGVDLKHARGVELVHALIEQADVIIENNSTGTMDNLSVGYQRIREINPRCVMTSSQLLGSHGAWAEWIGYGPNIQPIGGLMHLWSYEGDDAPAGSTSIFPDHLAGRLSALGALAALLRRERTGRGGHVEGSQAEGCVNMLGDLMLKAGVEPGSVVPRGNRNERGAPWGAYPCAGEQKWCVITVRDDSDWKKLRLALGEPEWAMRTELENLEGRRAAQDEIDEKLREWSATQDRMILSATLQAFGIPAAPMFTGSDQAQDAHYQARGYLHWVEQQDLGWICMEGPAFRASGMSEPIIEQAPRLGEHTREIAASLLGLDTAEIESLVEAGTLEVPKD